MKHINFLIVYTCTILTLSTLYAVQPIQPVFEQEFDLTRLQSVVFTTIIMLPLGIAPIFYGYFLETISSKKLLRYALVGLGSLEILFSLSNSYLALISIRALQGLIIPALLTSLMSYISYISPKEKIQQSIGVYIASTIFGGFIGRMLSGYVTDMLGWRVFFFTLGVCLILSFFALRYLQEDMKLNMEKPKFSQIKDVLKQKSFLSIYMVMFCIFFVFQGVLNFIPFWLNSLSNDVSTTKVGLVYAGYVVGIVISLRVMQIIKFFGSEVKTMMVGTFIYFLGIQTFLISSYQVIFWGMFVFCAGMFIVHSVASGYINKLAEKNKGISNGLYISFYYAGGVIGSFLPGIIYQYFGWNVYIFTLSFILFIPFFLIFNLQHSKKY